MSGAPIGRHVPPDPWERKIFWRNPASAGFTFAFPLMFLVIFAAINGNDASISRDGPRKFAQYYVPAIVAFGVISACYSNLAFSISIRRDRGVLKRVRGTPLSPTAYLAGIVGNAVIVSAILTALTITLGLTAYGVTLPHRYLGLIVTVALGAVCFTACGAAVATFIPNEDCRARDRQLRPVPAAVHLGNVRQDRARVGRVGSRRCSRSGISSSS